MVLNEIMHNNFSQKVIKMSDKLRVFDKKEILNIQFEK